jgi:hypothetical protein
VRDAEKQEYHFSSFVMGVITSPAFQMQRAEAATETGTR